MLQAVGSCRRMLLPSLRIHFQAELCSSVKCEWILRVILRSQPCGKQSSGGWMCDNELIRANSHLLEDSAQRATGRLLRCSINWHCFLCTSSQGHCVSTTDFVNLLCKLCHRWEACKNCKVGVGSHLWHPRRFIPVSSTDIVNMWCPAAWPALKREDTPRM